MIRLEGITKVYKMGDSEVHALDGVDLHIKPHEFVSVIGPSGSGKSTLMNMIGCLDVPTSGRYWIDGVEGSRMSDNQLADLRNKKLGFIFQQYNLLTKLTALENVELPLIYRGISAQKRHMMAAEALERVGLKDKMNHRPTELSGGQQQRVSIGRAIVKNPDILLCDEPTGALDYQTSKEILKLIEEINQKYGNTIIMVTHNEAIRNMADHVIKLRDGGVRHDDKNTSKVSAVELEW